MSVQAPISSQVSRISYIHLLLLDHVTLLRENHCSIRISYDRDIELVVSLNVDHQNQTHLFYYF